MVLPPKDVYSAVVKNFSNVEALLTVVYKMPFGSHVEEKKAIPANQVLNLEEKHVEEGHATFVGNICRVAIDGETHEEAVMVAPFIGVNSPVRDYIIEVHPKGEGLKLLAKP